MHTPPRLNLPPAPLQVRFEGERAEVYDPLRQKYVALTPEEWVRQHFVAWMVGAMGYPARLMANEVSIRLNDTLRRCDTVVYHRAGLRPLMVVEYKAPHVAVTQRVFDQIARYNMVVGARWLVVSNGLSHYVCRYNDAGEVTYEHRMPRYEEL